MRTFLILVGFLGLSTLHGQTISDALTYSDGDIQGSARYRALSGAMGALGGDPSAIGANPAASSVFNNSFASFSASFATSENSAKFLNSTTISDYSKFAIHQAGTSLVFKNTNENSPWKKFAIGLAYDKTKDHNQDWLVRGKNNTSIDSYFLNMANGFLESEIAINRDNNETVDDAYADIGSNFGSQGQHAFLGYESFILEPTNAEGVYNSNILASSFDQEYKYRTTGANSKFTFNASAQYEDKLYLGASVNAHSISYSRNISLLEDNDSGKGSINSVLFKNDLNTVGSGISLQVGAIAKLGNGFRLGASYNSPTWYEVEETTTDYIRTGSEGIDLSNNTTFTGTVLNPTVDNVYEPYTLKTAWNATASAAYVIDKKGFINIDYTVKDNSAIRFKPKNDSYFEQLNNSISETLGMTKALKVGGEYRLDKLSLRAGYHTEETPNIKTANLGNINGFSAGLGYKIGMYNLDFSYSNTRADVGQQLYNTGLTNRVYSKFNTSNFILTLGVHL